MPSAMPSAMPIPVAAAKCPVRQQQTHGLARTRRLTRRNTLTLLGSLRPGLGLSPATLCLRPPPSPPSPPSRGIHYRSTKPTMSLTYRYLVSREHSNPTSPTSPIPHTTSTTTTTHADADMSKRDHHAHIDSMPTLCPSPTTDLKSTATETIEETTSEAAASSSETSESTANDDMNPPQNDVPDAVERVPALPVKSSLRMSRVLDTLPLKLAPEDQPPFTQTAPHDVYLSSEEDASSSADDFSDFDFDSASEEPRNSVKRRGSHEDTARIISVVFSGKPCMIDLPRRSMSPSSQGSTSRPASRLRRISTDPMLGQVRRMSMSSSSSSSILHPPRTSSMGPRKLEKQRPQFLNIDPYASKAEPEEREDHEALRPRTPTAMFKRTLSLVRKKSRPTLNNYANQSRDNLTLSIPPQQHMEQVREVQEESSSRASMAAPRLPVTYHDIMKSAKRRTQTTPMTPLTPISPMSEPATPSTPNSTRNRLRNGFSIYCGADSFNPRVSRSRHPRPTSNGPPSLHSLSQLANSNLDIITSFSPLPSPTPSPTATTATSPYPFLLRITTHHPHLAKTAAVPSAREAQSTKQHPCVAPENHHPSATSTNARLRSSAPTANPRPEGPADHRTLRHDSLQENTKGTLTIHDALRIASGAVVFLGLRTDATEMLRAAAFAIASSRSSPSIRRRPLREAR
ncbi:hypothetical protein G7046_g7474 [Stylonectria norvegica]|nr:hypothetical protein G7046_g7474 [Stylonectria norvegica]